MSEEKIKKVFISYSWSNQETVKKVLNLGKSLVNDGIDVVLDRWALKPGHDKYAFMEKMVTDDSIDRVLMILDKGYMEKADERTGGVGTETQIITAKLYSKANETKFLPVVIEKNENNDAYLPVFLSYRLFIDLSGEGNSYQEQYEELLRDIYEMPDEAKPALGKMPAYLAKETVNTFEVSRQAKIIESTLESNPNRLSYMIKNFFDKLVEESETFGVKITGEEIDGRMVYDKINELYSVREAFEKVINVQMQLDKLDETLWTDFFEDYFNQVYRLKKGVGLATTLVESNEFLLHEFFLVLVSKLMNFKKWNELSALLNHKYSLLGEYQSESTFSPFRSYLEILEKTSTLKQEFNTPSISMKLLIDRASSKRELASIVEADVFLYHYCNINKMGGEWFPETYPYLGHQHKLKIFTSMKSKKHLERVLDIYNVEKKDLVEYMDKEGVLRGYSHLFEYVPQIRESITVKQLGISS